MTELILVFSCTMDILVLCPLSHGINTERLRDGYVCSSIIICTTNDLMHVKVYI